MAGKHHNKSDQYRKLLSDWVHSYIEKKSWEKYDDLHLDEIDSEFKQKLYWIEASFFIYKIILSIIKSDLYRCLLVIPLSYSDMETDINRLTWNNIKALLDLTPPSFYLFPNDNVNYQETLRDLVLLEKLSADCCCNVFFKEEKECEGEYNRCLYISSR